MTQALVKEIVDLVPHSPDNKQLMLAVIQSYEKKPRFTIAENSAETLPALQGDYREFVQIATPHFLGEEVKEDNAKSLFS
jgi:hypothetical protein